MVIRPVANAAERLAVQRQRHAIYVEELGYAQKHADPSARTVAEPMDAAGVIFGAFEGTQLVGSVRVNYGDVPDAFGEYEALYGLRRFGPWFPQGISIVTKLMIEPAYRAGTLMARFGVALYEHTRRTRPQTMFCVIDCVPALAGFFLRLGYRPIGPAFMHPAAGTVLPMAFAVYDRRHFEQVRSPLAAVCPTHDGPSSAWLARLLADEAAGTTLQASP